METKTQSALLTAAKNAQSHAYSPYSSFKVGASIQANDGKIYAGCNVENAAYPLGQCAEAGAIASMIVNGAKKINTIMILSPNAEFCPPCGGCRQKIQEFSDADTQVVMVDKNGRNKTMSISELLPLAFNLD